MWEVPSHHERRPGHYNLSMSFGTADMVVISDGAGTLHIVDTGDRSFKRRKWEVKITFINDILIFSEVVVCKQRIYMKLCMTCKLFLWLCQ